MTRFIPLVLLLLIWPLACAGPDKLAGAPPDQLYRMANEAADDKDYEEADRIVDRILDDFPFSKFAADAELLSADVKYRQEKFEEAAAAYRSFEQLHPTHERVDYAIFQRGRSYWEQSLPAGLDQTGANNAAEAYQKLLYGYPNSEYAETAKKELAEARSRLAAHEIHVGKYYLRRDRLTAALGRFEGVTQNYPDTPQRDEALQLALQIKTRLAEEKNTE